MCIKSGFFGRKGEQPDWKCYSLKYYCDNVQFLDQKSTYSYFSTKKRESYEVNLLPITFVTSKTIK